MKLGNITQYEHIKTADFRLKCLTNHRQDCKMTKAQYLSILLLNTV